MTSIAVAQMQIFNLFSYRIFFIKLVANVKRFSLDGIAKGALDADLVTWLLPMSGVCRPLYCLMKEPKTDLFALISNQRYCD